MSHSIFHHVYGLVADYGYWAVAVALLCEHAGVPVPGETALLLASFLAYSEHRLGLGWIIVVGTLAATLGGNLGYAIGEYGGRPLLERYQKFFRIPQSALERGEALFARYGAATVFVARFIFGMRVVAGPLAGVLRMRWRVFTLFNFLGAIAWVGFIAACGYLFGQHWRGLVRMVVRFNVAAAIVAAAVVLYLWWRQRREADSSA